MVLNIIFNISLHLKLQMRDLQAIWIKFKHVLQPKEKQSLLKECNFITSSFLFIFINFCLHLYEISNYLFFINPVNIKYV